MSLCNGSNPLTQLAAESVDRRVAEDRLGENLTLVRVVSEVVQELESRRETSEAGYERFLADVWVGVVLTLMVLSCVCCMCSCLLYHKFQQWKSHVLEERATASRDPNYRAGDTESLPSYTLVSGLPSYEEALKQLKVVQELRRGPDYVAIDCGKRAEADAALPLSAASLNRCGFVQTCGRVSVAELLQLHKLQQQRRHKVGTDLDQEEQGAAEVSKTGAAPAEETFVRADV